MTSPPDPLNSDSYRTPRPSFVEEESNPVIGFLCVLLLVGALFVAGPFAPYHALFLGCAGLLMVLFPPSVTLSRRWWILAGVFVVAGLGQFLPAAWFSQPVWRGTFEHLGLITGNQVTIQVQQAVETFTLFVAILFTGLWMAGQRASGKQVRFWALMFTLGVAVYAILSWFLQHTKGPGAVYGFFPNRNHTATFLAMGSICGLGSILQAHREKRHVAMGFALLGTAICLWALGAWSISRSGILLIGLGFLLWISLLGKHYLGRHAIKVLLLIGLVVVGVFLLTDSHVKERIVQTADRAHALPEKNFESATDENKQVMTADSYLDFRLPIAIEALTLIRDFKWTGVGAGQFRFIFPQYRDATSVVNNAECFHPESDWLWMASEVGVIATGALAILVGLAFWKARGSIVNGRDRAVRSACMVAAMIVPIHGIFDVPGHRIVIAWSAAFLFCLCLSSTTSGSTPKRPRPKALPFQVGGAVLLLLAGYLAMTRTESGPRLAIQTAPTALMAAEQLWKEDYQLQLAAKTKGEVYQPTAEEDRIEKAIRLITAARSLAPLDSSLLRYQLYLAMNFDDRNAWIDHISKLEEVLNPMNIGSSVKQAELWSTYNVDRSFAHMQEAVRRAERLDEIAVTPGKTRKYLMVQLKMIAKGKPELEKKLVELN